MLSSPSSTLSSPVEKEDSSYGKFQGNGHAPLMAMVEITNRCNMACPLCFSDANNPSDHVPFDECLARLRRLKEVSGPVPVQISGGEPTLHPKLHEIISEAHAMGFRNIELITNGIKISRDPSYLRALVNRGLTAVYLQFDGLTRDTYMQIRGQDMTEVRQAAVEAVRSAGICCTLAVAVTRGVNDHELGDIVRFSFENVDTIRAINFQSATKFTGRFEVAEAESGGYSLPALLDLLAEQTGMPADGFRSEFLGHPRCNAMTLAYQVEGEMKSLFSYIKRDTLMALIGDDARTKVLDLFMGKVKFCAKHLTNTHALAALREAAPIFGKDPRNVLKSKHLLVFAKSFMERNAMENERIDQCSYGISGEDGVYSFCAFNNLYRFANRTLSFR